MQLSLWKRTGARECMSLYTTHISQMHVCSLLTILFLLEDLDRTLGEYDYGNMIVPSNEDYISISKQQNENISNGSGVSSIHSK